MLKHTFISLKEIIQNCMKNIDLLLLLLLLLLLFQVYFILLHDYLYSLYFYLVL